MTTPHQPQPGEEEDPETGVIRDEDGLVVDEYSDETFEEPESVDALDVPRALREEGVLIDVSEEGDGIEETEIFDAVSSADTIDTGARRPPDDDAEMGLGAEPHSADELERAAIGRALRGPAGVTRDDEVHGERLLDDPNRVDEDEV